LEDGRGGGVATYAPGSASGAKSSISLHEQKMSFSGKEAAEIGAALEEHSILQQLQSLDFDCEWPGNWDDGEDEEAERQNSNRWTYTVLRSMILQFPKLATIRLVVCT
jgi:hypothetical protein